MLFVISRTDHAADPIGNVPHDGNGVEDAVHQVEQRAVRPEHAAQNTGAEKSATVASGIARARLVSGDNRQRLRIRVYDASPTLLQLVQGRLFGLQERKMAAHDHRGSNCGHSMVVYSYPRPRTPGRDHYKLRLFGKNILMFRFHVVQLNLLDWRDFLRHPNPLASALMARMHILPQDRPRVKAECVRLAAHFATTIPARKLKAISKFIDSYLRLNPAEIQAYQEYVQEFDPKEKEQMREIITTWESDAMARGQAEGRAMGQTEGQMTMLQVALRQRFGAASEALLSQLPEQPGSELLQELMKAAIVAPDLESILQLLPSSHN